MKTEPKSLRSICALTLMFVAFAPTLSDAFIVGDETPWRTTASGQRSRNGIAGTLTWSVVPDGTSVTDGVSSLGASNLNAFFDSTFTGNKSGISILEDAFGRWDELSGLSFVYEPNDDGGTHNNRAGRLGVRGDIRIAGVSIDGSGDTLAFNFFPDVGDMVLDTSESADFGRSANNYRFLRNTVMHEIGHGFGLDHVVSSTHRLLLEPSVDVRFDGPQLDEVRAIQFYFGDAFEEDNQGLGNGTANRASDLGALTVGAQLAIGTDANTSTQTVLPTATDFVSISNDSDVDFYSFTVSEYSSLNAELTPLGGTFSQGTDGGSQSSFNASARSDLSLVVFDSNGVSVLGNASETAAGEAESLSEIQLEPGTYYSRITGADDTIQLYMLELDLAALPGDYNVDGFVDAADETVWRDLLGTNVAIGSTADGNRNGRVDNGDYQIWVDNFGTDYRGTAGFVTSVPEPKFTPLFGALLLFLFQASRVRKHAG